MSYYYLYTNRLNFQCVAEFNGTTNQWRNYTIGPNPTDMAHGIGSICQDSQGYFHTIFGCHETPMKHYKSTNPWSVSAWTMQSDIGTACTYPRLIVLDNGTLFCEYRKTISSGSDYELHYYISTNNGATWTDFTWADWGAGEAPYLQAVYDPVNYRMWFSGTPYNYSYSARGGNIYLCYIDLDNFHVYGCNGSYDMGMTMTRAEANQRAVIYQGTIGIGGGTNSPNAELTINETGYAVLTIDEGNTWRILQMRQNGSTGWYPAEFVCNKVYCAVSPQSGGYTIYWDDEEPTCYASNAGGIQIWTRNMTTDTWGMKGWLLAPNQATAGTSWTTSKFNPSKGLFQIFERDWLDEDSGNYTILTYSHAIGKFIMNGDHNVTEEEPPVPGVAPTITTTPDTTAVNTTAHVQDFNAVGDTPLTWNMTSNATWLSIVASTGVVSGTPNRTGSFWVNITVNNSEGSDYVNYTLVVSEYVAPAWQDTADMMWWMSNMLLPIVIVFMLLLFFLAVARDRRR